LCDLQSQTTRSFDTIQVLTEAVEQYPLLQEALQGTLQAASYYTTLAALTVCSSWLDCDSTDSLTQDTALAYAQACAADVSRSLTLRSKDMYRPMHIAQYSNSPLLINAETVQQFSFCPIVDIEEKQQVFLHQVVSFSTYANTVSSFHNQVTAAHRVVLEVPDVMMTYYSSNTTQSATGSKPHM
jgi:hypothetical protein